MSSEIKNFLDNQIDPLIKEINELKDINRKLVDIAFFFMKNYAKKLEDFDQKEMSELEDKVNMLEAIESKGG